MDNLVIQPCSFRALGSAYRLHCTAFPSPYGWGRLLYYKLRFPRYFLVACQDGEVRGYVIAGRSYVWRKGWVGEIISLATAPQARRQGIATRLLARVLTELQQAHLPAAYLQVAVSNEPAQKLYHKFGFEREQHLPRYYSDGEDAYLLRKSLEAREM
jgi:ribosomal-protein-alanine N-acetyltransferase